MYKFLRKYWLRMTLVFLATICVVITIARLAFSHQTPEIDSANADAPATNSARSLSLQPTVDSWVASLPKGSDAGVMIYDLDSRQIIAEYQAHKTFQSASLYKLFFVYDGFVQIANGSDDATSRFVTTSDKGPLTLVTCLDLMLRESYNGCADPMYNDPVRSERVAEMITELNLTATDSTGLSSSPADITTLLKLYYEHPDFDQITWQIIKDAMLNQPPTTDDWRQGLPSGFKTALVYDKVGWNYDGRRWTIFNDAAIINFPDQDRNFIVVVMTSNLPNFSYLVQLGDDIETAILYSFLE